MLLNPHDTDSLKAYLLLYKLFFHPIESLEIMLMDFGSERRMEALDRTCFKKKGESNGAKLSNTIATREGTKSLLFCCLVDKKASK